MRAGEGPTFIEGKTYRYRGHYEGDPMIHRPSGEMEAWRARDPIAGFRQRLLAKLSRAGGDLGRSKKSDFTR